MTSISVQGDNEDFSFLDDKDIDIIADFLNKCSESSEHEASVNPKIPSNSESTSIHETAFNYVTVSNHKTNTSYDTNSNFQTSCIISNLSKTSSSTIKDTSSSSLSSISSDESDSPPKNTPKIEKEKKPGKNNKKLIYKLEKKNTSIHETINYETASNNVTISNHKTNTSHDTTSNIETSCIISNLSNTSSSTIKDISISSLSNISSDESDSPSKITPKKKKEKKPGKSNKKLIYKLEKTMFRLFKESYICTAIHFGQFSTIIKCKDAASNLYAIKILKDKERKNPRGKEKENMLLDMQIKYPKSSLFSIFFWPGFLFLKRWCFMMEFYPKTLKQAMHEMNNKPFHMKKVQELARQLVAAVTFLKYAHIVHSDIKPSHILLDRSNEKLRLCGFDDAYYHGRKSTSPKTGSLNYRAPEIILGYSPEKGYSIDVWSTAVVLLEMAIGSKIFPGYTNNEVLYQQMCKLGCVPNEMIAKSKYSSEYFSWHMFKRIDGSTKTYYKKNHFWLTNKVEKMVSDAQTYHYKGYYDETANKKQRSKEETKFKRKKDSFIAMIMQMLVVIPQDRFSIDDVYSDPFIYEMFDK